MSDPISALAVLAIATGLIIATYNLHRSVAHLETEVRRTRTLARLSVIALAAHLDGRDVTIDIGECTCPRCQPMPLRTDEHE
jgi:hypothetical protein